MTSPGSDAAHQCFKVGLQHHQRGDNLNKTCCAMFTCNRQNRIK